MLVAIRDARGDDIDRKVLEGNHDSFRQTQKSSVLSGTEINMHIWENDGGQLMVGEGLILILICFLT